MDIKPPRKPKSFGKPKEEASLRGLYESSKEAAEGPEPEKDQLEDLDPLKGFNLDNKGDTTTVVVKKSRFSKKKKLIVAFSLLLIIGGVASYLIFNKKEEQTITATTQEEKPTEEPTKYYSPLSGVEVASETIANRPVTGIMVENSPDARPQSGLVDADLVYEAIAEGGVTRFLATYQESTPAEIGPVRSARPYYLDYILGLDGSYGHVGGSPEALQDIKSLGVKDLDEFSNPNAYWRSSKHYAPHNVYTSFEKLDKANQQKNYTKSTFKPLVRKIDVPQTPTANNINFELSGRNYNANFAYSPETNSYLRNMGGLPHKDAITGEQINPKVVVALITDYNVSSDGYHSEYKTVGTGKIFVFQDGIVSEGKWSKADRKASLELTDKNGLPMNLNRGKTWITLVASSDDVRYASQ